MLRDLRRRLAILVLVGLGPALVAALVVPTTLGSPASPQQGPEVILVEETITIADSVSARGPAVIAVEETITVSDAVTLLPPVALLVEETIAVADSANVRGPAVIAVEETITVSDDPGLWWRATRLTYTGPGSAPIGSTVTLSAVLRAARGGARLEGRVVTFRLGSQTATATTSRRGGASARLTLTQPAGVYTLESIFGGDTGYLASTDRDSFTISPSSDLAITKRDDPDPVQLGADVTYTVEVTNNGPSPATGVRLVDNLPKKATLVLTSLGASCRRARGNSPLLCELGSLAAGASVKVTIVVSPGTPGLLTNRVTVTANEPDPEPTNNTAKATTTVRR